MTDYRAAYDGFDLAAAASVLSNGLKPGLNACYECCDRHGADDPALSHEDADGDFQRFTFGTLQVAAARFANVLAAHGVRAGDCVAALLPRTPELLITMLGTWRLGAVYQPLFTAFGPKAIEHRLTNANARVVVVDAANRPKLEGLDAACESITVASDNAAGDGNDFWAQMTSAPSQFTPVGLGPDAPFLRMFTSGTTGAPKSLDVPLKAMAAFVAYMRDGIDLRPEDNFWNLADPGWAYGLYYAVIGPLAMGRETLFIERPFTAERAIDVIREQRITNLAGSPTAFRRIVAAGPEAVKAIRGQLRVVSSAGEPLTPEVIRWFKQHLDVTVHDQYGQTELGMVIGNHHALTHPVRLGSSGVPSPGYRMVVIDDAGSELGPRQPGMLAVDRSRSPLFWFSGYREVARKDERYYRTGDAAEWHEDGSVSFIGRADDVITSSGYRIGPFDVESALAEHPAVLESAVVGKPDPERTEIVKAFVVLKPGFAASTELAETLKQQVRARLSAHAYPRELEFVAELPKTPSGKIQRFLLRNQQKSPS